MSEYALLSLKVSRHQLW